jgi:chemotaxis protein CheZ
MDCAMAGGANIEDGKLRLARMLVDHLEAGNDEGAMSVLAELAGFRDRLMFREVARLIRELHDSINGFVMDARLVSIARHEMPDAAERLRYVIATTEAAANTTLTAVEESLPLADSLRAAARDLAERWARFNSRQLSVDDFRALSAELSEFLTATQANTEELHQRLSDVLLAQGYQDITGQVIRKVIDLVEDVEGKLVELVRLSGSAMPPAEAQPRSAGSAAAHGPAVPGVDTGDVVNGQDDVDDLLSSLGV